MSQVGGKESSPEAVTGRGVIQGSEDRPKETEEIFEK